MKVLHEILVPLLSVNDQTLVIQELSLENGQAVKKGDTIALLETSKTVFTVESEANGFVEYFCKAGEEKPVNSVLARIYETRPTAEKTADENVNGRPKESTDKIFNKSLEKTLFSSKAIELLHTFKLDKRLFEGSDLVSSGDVRKMAGSDYQPKENRNAVSQKLTSPQKLPDSPGGKSVKIGGSKLREISYLSSVQSAGLVSVIHTYVDVEEVMPFLEWQMKYLKSSLLPLVMFESARLLKKFPEFNSYYHDQSLFYYEGVHVGFAADLGKGLKVLKVTDTDKKTVREIEEEIFRLSGAYMDNKLLLSELSGVSFTVTDLSNEGVAFFQPLVNMKNAAILGLSALDIKLSRATFSLAFDHRVTEGKQAARFLSELKSRIESYSSALFTKEAEQNRVASIVCHRCHKTLLDDEGAVGFARCITPTGVEGYVCQACFKGF